MKTFTKYILQALAIAGFGFILLNLTFLLDWGFQNQVKLIVQSLFTVDPFSVSWFPPVMHLAFVALIGLISWFIFRSRLTTIYKTIYMPVPLATVFVIIGIFLYRNPIIAYLAGTIFAVSVLYYLYRTNQPWLYYYTLILVSLVMLIANVLGVEI